MPRKKPAIPVTKAEFQPWLEKELGKPLHKRRVKPDPVRK